MAESIERIEQDSITVEVTKNSVNKRYGWAIKVRMFALPGTYVSEEEGNRARALIDTLDAELRQKYGEEAGS